MLRIYHIFCIGFLFLVGCKTHTNSNDKTQTPKTQVEIPYQFSKAALLQHVKELSSDAYEGRETGTQGAEKAKRYIIQNFEKLGVQPLGNMFPQPFPMPKNAKTVQGENIIGYIKGSEKLNEYIVLSAHYDHEGIKNGVIYNGADDDASGISALFAFAEYFKKYPPKHSVIFAAFDAEEKGLIGSYFYVEHPIVSKNQLKLNINMDMISRSDKKEVFAVGPQHYPKLVSIVENTKTTGDVQLKIGHKEWTFASDHAGFHKAGVPFVYFGVEDHADYHKPTDDYENIHPEFYANAVQTIINFFVLVDATQL